MKRRSLWAAVIAVFIASCATLKAPFESNAEERFNEGLEALGRGDYPVAYRHLSWVAEHHSSERVGQQALLTLSAMELDPRNQARRIDVGSDMAASYLRLPEKPLWTQPVAQTLYLLSLELGAAEERAERAERQAERVAERLPNLPGPSVTAKLRTTEQERERLARRVDALEKQLQEKEQELERIKKTIRR